MERAERVFSSSPSWKRKKKQDGCLLRYVGQSIDYYADDTTLYLLFHRRSELALDILVMTCKV